MISLRIKAFLLVFITSVVISSEAYSDDRKLENSLKEFGDIDSTLLKSDRSKNISEKIEETFLGKINFNGIGLIAIERTKLPDDLWINSSEKALSEKLL